jgi:hypothetical protein
MTKLTDKEILDFVRDNLTLDKEYGLVVLGGVKGSVWGNVDGNVWGNVGRSVKGNVDGDVLGDVDGYVMGNVGRSVGGSVNGSVGGGVLGEVNGKKVTFALWRGEKWKPRAEVADWVAYTIALQQAVEWHCDGKVVPPDVAKLCPHHSERLNEALTQPQREWVRLTDEEIHSLPVFYEDRIIYQVVKLAEAKLKEKNK